MDSSNASSVASTNVLSKPRLIVILPIGVSLLILMLVSSILIFLFIKKCPRKKKRTIQRQKVIIRRHSELKAVTPDDPHTTLLEQNDSEPISNIRIINNVFITNPLLDQKRRDTLPDTSRPSIHSITNPLSERNDNDDLSDLDLSNIPLRRPRLSSKNLADSSLLQNANRSSRGSIENPYVVEFKQQENEARKQRINSGISIGSKTSDESCL